MKKVRKVGVVGAGLMGSGIARFFSQHNLEVILKDRDDLSLWKGLEATMREAHSAYDAAGYVVKDKSLSPLIRGTLDYADLKDADLIIETVPEDIKIKKEVLREVSAQTKKDALIATNTSSIPLGELVSAVSHPERFLGMHFFYPADRRELVEVVRAKGTGIEAMDLAMSLLKRFGKKPVAVNDSPGFLVNRVTALYITETNFALLDGLSIEDIDKLLLEFGMPVGPFFYLDLVGTETAFRINSIIAQGLKSPRLKISPVIEKIYLSERKGEKAPFYLRQGEKFTPNPLIYDILNIGFRPVAQKDVKGLTDYLERIVYSVINETARCLEEGIVADAGTADMALSLGMGFPRGGPLRYADSIGIKKIVDALDTLRGKYGERFSCASLLRKLAAEGRSFY